MKEPISLRCVRWTARIGSLLCVAGVLMFVFGEGLSWSALRGREWFLFLFFPCGLCFGMILAWRWEGVGGLVALGSLVAFYLVHYLTSQSFPRGFAFGVLAMPGILFCVCWLWTRWRARQLAP